MFCVCSNTVLIFENFHYGLSFLESNKMYFFAHDLINYVDHLPPSYLRHGTRIIDSVKLSDLPSNALVTVHLRGHGGKGGFGSLLRAIGSQIERTTDQKSKRFVSRL